MIEYSALTLDDAPELHRLIVRTEAHDGIRRVLELDELAEELSSDATDLEEGSLVARVDGAIVGVLYLYHRRADEVEQRCLLEGAVAPEHRGQGIGRALFEFGIRRSTEVLRAINDDLPKFIRVHAYDYVEPSTRLATRMGFKPTRYFEELLRPLTDLPDRRSVDGLTIVPWPADREDEIRVAKNTAFLDHWGSVPSSEASWHEQVHGYGSRPDLSFVGLDAATGQVVAVLFSTRYEADDELLGRSDGWIQTLATLREWRGRGVGSALLIEAFHRYRDEGLTHASLGVDTENPSGAARLYRNLGFELAQRVVTYQIEV